MIVESPFLQIVSGDSKIAVTVPAGTEMTIVTPEGKMFECICRSEIIITDGISMDEFMASNFVEVP